MMVETFIQSVLDGLLLSLCCLGLMGREKGKFDCLLPFLFAGVCLVVRQVFGFSTADLAYAVLPVNTVISFMFLFLAVLLINSIWFQRVEGHAFYGTIAAFALYLLLRELCLVVFYLCGVEETAWFLYVSRVLSLMLWLAIWAVGVLRWLREQLSDGSLTVRIIVSNTAILLLLILVVFRFDLSLMFRWLPVTAGTLALLLFVDGIAILIEQHRIQSQRRTKLLEQYLPLVEELIEQVRARQHEFNNKMMAVSAAMAAANDLEEAKSDVASLLQNAKLDSIDRELLKCDSKVICGMIFGKSKQAGLKCIRLDVSMAGAFLHRSLPEADWAEVIGVLIDNAIEASSPGAVLYVKAVEENGGLLFTVSNPHHALSNVEFVQMFKRGWSTKIASGHGYGLFNVRSMVERYKGKIIARNEAIEGTHYITIGVLIS
ncbi:sensor histidine kinase CitA [Oxobacter pfennigii]|uniref:Sensor histidine kinase CitA n=1 Tax=Oxobacter pfennigii TaxID=36849 RepID=A0A0P8W9W5_9CLOT|nr:GHKL domain-containing protein [Oxobacter pfennigii]KPU44757.1 sensor histidine kinase CitA [Oxobacter pfennigii]